MGSLTDEKPKSLVEFSGKPIISYQIDILRSLKFDMIVVVKGYKSDCFNYKNIKYYEVHENKNMIYSLFQAIDEFDEDLIISYGDIIYSKNVLDALLSSPFDISVIYDENWRDLYSLRYEYPEKEAESFLIEPSKKITEIGEQLPDPKKIQGQFVGLIKLSKTGAKLFKEFYLKSQKEYRDKIFIRGRTFENIYTTDFLQALINHGYSVCGCAIKNGWLEFDTPKDLYTYEKLLRNGKLSKIIQI